MQSMFCMIRQLCSFLLTGYLVMLLCSPHLSFDYSFSVLLPSPSVSPSPVISPCHVCQLPAITLSLSNMMHLPDHGRLPRLFSLCRSLQPLRQRFPSLLPCVWPFSVPFITLFQFLGPKRENPIKWEKKFSWHSVQTLLVMLVLNLSVQIPAVDRADPPLQHSYDWVFCPLRLSVYCISGASGKWGPDSAVEGNKGRFHSLKYVFEG